ncbi:hypothetical protein N9118_09420 [Akkermansiaceae bacterium]|nr:hypothetical protein [Akkermansiaceae bacterium]
MNGRAARAQNTPNLRKRQPEIELGRPKRKPFWGKPDGKRLSSLLPSPAVTLTQG